MHPAPRVFVPAESVLRCLQLHHLLEDKKVHSSELMWIHLCHLRSLPSPALVFTELTCVYLYSCPPVFTVPYLPHVCPETPPQAGLHTKLARDIQRKERGHLVLPPAPWSQWYHPDSEPPQYCLGPQEHSPDQVLTGVPF